MYRLGVAQVWLDYLKRRSQTGCVQMATRAITNTPDIELSRDHVTHQFSSSGSVKVTKPLQIITALLSPADTAKESEEDTKRPSQYAFLDRLMREAGGDYIYSLRKAEEYKREAKGGNLQIHTLKDARDDPPRGLRG